MNSPHFSSTSCNLPDTAKEHWIPSTSHTFSYGDNSIERQRSTSKLIMFDVFNSTLLTKNINRYHTENFALLCFSKKCSALSWKVPQWFGACLLKSLNWQYAWNTWWLVLILLTFSTQPEQAACPQISDTCQPLCWPEWLPMWKRRAYVDLIILQCLRISLISCHLVITHNWQKICQSS